MPEKLFPTQIFVWKCDKSFKHQQVPENHARTKKKEETHGKAFTNMKEAEVSITMHMVINAYYNVICLTCNHCKGLQGTILQISVSMWNPLLQNKQDTTCRRILNTRQQRISVLKASVSNQNQHTRGFMLMSGIWMLEIYKPTNYKNTGLFSKRIHNILIYTYTCSWRIGPANKTFENTKTKRYPTTAY